MAAEVVSGKIGDAQLDGHAPIGWSLLAGVEPFIQTITLDADEARKVLPVDGRSSEALTLDITTHDGKRLKAEKVYVIGEAETIDPYRRTVLVADRRIWWSRKRIKGRFNIRRRSGDRRRLSEDGVPQQLQQVVDDVAYAPWSLKDGKPWKADEVVKRVLDELVGGDWMGSLTEFPAVTVEDLEIDDEGGPGLARALAFLVGADVYVGLDGRLRIFDSTDVRATGNWVEAWKRDNPLFANGRYPAFSDRSALRPKKVSVLFQVEQEVRFDSLHSGETVTLDQRALYNVAPIPDPTLSVNGKTRVAGTLATFDELFTAWNAAKGNNDVPDITDELLREFWLSGFAEAYWGGLGNLAPAVVWIERIAACRAHYRQTFRINRRWVDRVFQFRPYRVSILDEETGTKARAQAFAGYCIVPSIKGVLSSPDKGFYMFNVDGSVDPGESLANGRVAPCLVEILDDELGVLRLNYQTDLLGHYRQIVPSRVTNVPTLNPSQGSNVLPLTMDSSLVGEGGASVALEERNRVSVVLTCVPAAPNGKGQFYAIDVGAEEAVALLPRGAQAYAKKSSGPEWELRVGGQVTTARFAWSDSLAVEIEKSFGVGTTVEQANREGRGALASLLCNRKEMEALARSMAASVYASLVDHWVGDLVMDMDPGAPLAGNMRQVSHSIDMNGVTSTTVMLRGDSVASDPMATLPDSARRLFQRTVQP